MAWYMVWPGGHGKGYGNAWRASHGVWYGMADRAWYIVWPGSHSMVLWYGLVDLAWDIVWSGGHRMVYGMAWRASHGIWLCPGRQGMGLGIVYGMDLRAWHGIWFGLAGKEWCMVLTGGHGMIYVVAWRPWRCICDGLDGITWYMVWPGGHRTVYGMAWRGMAWYVIRHSITCLKAWPWDIVPFTCGVADVSWRSCSHVRDSFTRRRLFTCMLRSHVQFLFSLGGDSK